MSLLTDCSGRSPTRLRVPLENVLCLSIQTPCHVSFWLEILATMLALFFGFVPCSTSLKARTMLRQIITRAFLPTFDRELTTAVRREVGSMGKDLCPLQTASAFSFRPASGAGAFGRTAAAQAPARAIRVEKPVTSNGLFHG